MDTITWINTSKNNWFGTRIVTHYLKTPHRTVCGVRVVNPSAADIKEANCIPCLERLNKKRLKRADAPPSQDEINAKVLEYKANGGVITTLPPSPSYRTDMIFPERGNGVIMGGFSELDLDELP